MLISFPLMAERPSADEHVQIRAATIGETEQFLEIFSAAFRLDRDAARPLFYRDPFFDLKLKRVCLVDGVIVSCLTVVPCRLRVGTGVVPMAGIAGVATRPDRRRRGYAGKLLEDTIRQSPDLGFPISGLFPADPDYYARFGWVHATESTTWSIRREALSIIDIKACVRPIAGSHPADVGAVAALHDEATRGRTGACYRGAMRWRVIHEMMAGRETYVVDNGDRIEGYVNVEHAPERKALSVHEMHASTKEAAYALVAFLAAQENVETIEWIADAADVEAFGLTDMSTPTVEPDAMLRISDICGALGAVHAAVYGSVLAEVRTSLTVIIRDPINAGNEIPVTIDARGVRRGADGAYAVATDIGTLTRLFVGYKSANEAHESGSLYASDDRSFALAERLFPRRSPQIPVLDRL